MKLRDYQKQAVALMLSKKKCILALRTGSGKTVTCLDFMKRLDKYSLVVCQKNKLMDWMTEGEAYGYSKFRLINYSQVHKYYKLKNKIEVLIIDESQNMGSYSTLKGRTLIDMAKMAEYVIFVSATPLRNRPTELYWPLKICGAYDRTLESFRIKYCGAFILPKRNILVDGRTITNRTELQNLKNSVSIDTSANICQVKLNIKTIEIDSDINKYVGKSKKLNVPDFTETSKVRASTGTEKLEFFREYIKHNKLHKKAVFFTHHRKVTTEVADILKCPKIIGGMNIAQKSINIENFIKAEEGYLVVSMRSGSEGLNIPNCDTCYFLELDFSPVIYKQAYSRIVRDVKDTSINIYYFKLKNEHASLLNELKSNYENF